MPQILHSVVDPIVNAGDKQFLELIGSERFGFFLLSIYLINSVIQYLNNSKQESSSMLTENH